MLKSPLARNGLFLAISALLVPCQAVAQEEEQTSVLDAIEIKGEYIPQPLLETAEVVSVITSEDLQRSGDGNAAEALARVSGLSLVGGKFVYVRGLGERYSAAVLNGSSLPSPEPLQRVVPLDLFPSSIIDSVVVQKTYSARYPGEFGGGIIDLKTVAVPDEPFLSVTLGTGGNSETTYKSGLTYYGSETDILGYDDGTRDMPAALRAAIATGNRVDLGNFSQADLDIIGRSLVNAPLNLLQRDDEVNPDFNAEITGGRKFDMGWGSLGVIAVAGFDSKWQTREGKQQEGIVENGAISVRTNYDFESTQNDVNTNALLGFGAQWGNHEIRWTNLYVHSTTKEARSRAGNDELAGAEVRDDYTEWFERELLNTQFTGKHAFGEYKDLTVEWRAAYAETTRDAPYEKGIRYRLVDGVYLHNASQEQNYTRFSRVEDDVFSAGVDVGYLLATEDRDYQLSAGLAYSDNDRSAVSREFRFLALDGALPLNIQLERIDFLLSNPNIGPGLLGLRETTGADGAAAYDANLEVEAFYVQAETAITPNVKATAGLRFESATQSVTPIDLFSATLLPTANPLDESYVLPAATVTWNFREDMQLRFGASKTIARPQFRELAPQQYLDTDLDRVFIGNPYLVDTELLNLDARFEWYFAEGEHFTFGAFYKDLDNPVESIVNEAGATIQQTYINAPSASLYGFETELKKHFDSPFEWTFLGDARLFLAANYTYTQTEVSVDADDVVFPLAGGGSPRPAAELVRDGSRLQGQSEHLANIQFGLEDVATGSQAILLVNHAGERISARGRPGQPDLIQDPGTTVDLVLRRGFAAWGQDLSVSFAARNLFGEDYEEFQELGGGRVDINRYDLGTSFSLSITANF
jgi:outer membrane receptor protein involved in Fe transport